MQRLPCPGKRAIVVAEIRFRCQRGAGVYPRLVGVLDLQQSMLKGVTDEGGPARDPDLLHGSRFVRLNSSSAQEQLLGHFFSGVAKRYQTDDLGFAL